MTDWPANMPKPTWESKDGSVLLYHGDCTRLLPLLPDGCVDAVVTDPPYPDAHLEYGTFNPAMISAVNAMQMVFWSATADFPMDSTAVHIWDKKTGCGSWYERIFERNGGAECRVYRHYLINSTVAASYTGDGWFDHDSQKPIRLMVQIVEDSRGTAILDPYMGSGTTGVACVRLSRRFIGIEIERRYFDIAVRRIEEAFDSQALFRQDEQREPDPELFDAANDSAKNVAVPESSLDSNERAKA